MSLFFHVPRRAKNLVCIISTQAFQQSQCHRCPFFIASWYCVSSSQLAEREIVKPANVWLCAGRISLLIYCMTLLHKAVVRYAVRSVYLWGCLPVVKSRCCLRLTHKTLRVPCGLLMSTCSATISSIFLSPSPFLSSLPSLCDITVWLGRMERLLALEIDVAVCSWPHSHSHGRHTSLLMHTHPHISTLLSYASVQFTIHTLQSDKLPAHTQTHTDSGAVLCGLR